MGINKFGQIGKLKEEKIEEYERLHADVWPDVLKKISECNIRNYSIFRFQSYVFSYFEYIGSDYEEDWKQILSQESGGCIPIHVFKNTVWMSKANSFMI